MALQPVWHISEASFFLGESKVMERIEWEEKEEVEVMLFRVVAWLV